MEYMTLEKAFHNPNIDEHALLDERLNSPETVTLNLNISDNAAFFTVTPEIYKAILRVEKADKEVLRHTDRLPEKALDQFSIRNLIDEIVITNEIEGVNSTRKEVDDALKSLERNDRKKRFHGLAKKYAMLKSGTWDSVETPADIRKIYDTLVYPEIEADKPDHLPDGELFRKDFVSVYDKAQREIHKGVMPESRIIEYLESSLDFLNESTEAEDLVKIAVFHFLFGYVHPFYDGNGRLNRFISSQYIAERYEPIIGLGLSCAIKKRLDEYYSAFQKCENPLNRGDITPFVITFCSIVADAAENIERSLNEKRMLLKHYSSILSLKIADSKMTARCDDIAYVLLQASLFSDYGIATKELMDIYGISRGSVRRKLKEIDDTLHIIKTMNGKEACFMLDLDELDSSKPGVKSSNDMTPQGI